MISKILNEVAQTLIATPSETQASMVDASQGAAKQLSGTMAAMARPRLLIVDNDPFSFELFADIFNGEYEVQFATNGKAALDIAAEGFLDLVLLDVMMPEMDGYEVCRRLKAETRTSNIPIIFITAVDYLAAETIGLELGAVDYITKPINPAAVKARVNNQIKLKWALDRLKQAAALEQVLRQDLLELLELKSRDQPVH